MATSRGAARNRTLLALVVFGVIVGWARCTFQRSDGLPPFDRRFVGCFEGAVTDPPGAGTVVVVIEDPIAADNLALGGCLRATIGEKTPFVTLAGSVQEVQEQAVLGGVEAGKPGFLTVRVERRPPGIADNATEIDVEIEGGSDRPFNLATGLIRCAPPPDTCAGLARALAAPATAQPDVRLP